MAKSKSKKTNKKVTKNAQPAASSFTAAMQASARKNQPLNPTMSLTQLSVGFVGFFIANAIVFYLANRLFPTQLVLGTHLLTPFAALMYANFVFTLLLVGATPVIEAVAEQTQTKLKDMHWMGLYFVINTAALWFVARFAEQLGLGIASWLVAVLVAIVLDFVQGMVVKVVTDNVK